MGFWIGAVLMVAGSPLYGPAWVELSRAPSSDDMYCAAFDVRQWAVALSDEGPLVHPQADRGPDDDLPFAVPRGEDRSGDRHVLAVAGGWLVGFDAGEFGGGLWFADGSKWTRLRPPADATAAADDIFRAENVRGLVSLEGGATLVLMGLDHLSGRSGRVFTVLPRRGRHALVRGTPLDSSPMAWEAVDGQLEVLTAGGIWRASSGEATRVVSVDFGITYPSSLVIDRDGRRYVGMRRYVLVLEPSSSPWKQTWYGPSDCPRSRRDRVGACSCVQ